MENKIDLYSTHTEYLDDVFAFKGRVNTAIEFGMGNYSTDLLIKNCDKITSIEMQSVEWYDNMVKKFSDKKNWEACKLIGAFEYLKYQFPAKIDFAFVDGHGDSRPECINLMMDKKCPIIVAHDTEENGYRWNLVKENNGYKKIIFKKYDNWSTIWTTDYDLYNFLLEKHSNTITI